MKLASACLALMFGLFASLSARAEWSVSIDIAPPPLLLYAQPPAPDEGFIWVPGYWSWSDADRGYFWVPGTWVLAPHEGDLWTPGYWAFENARYTWHIGYWGSRVGFYGGINYGYGYFGSGYQGGRWERGTFRYNGAISNIDRRVIRNVYNAPATDRHDASRISFNGGRAGTPVRPTAGQRQFQSIGHAGPRDEQTQHETAARDMPTQRATGPHGLPQVAATPRPSEYSAPGVEHVRPAPTLRPGWPAAMQGGRVPAQRPIPAQQPGERQAAPQARPEPRGPAGRPEQRQQDGPAHRER